MSKYDPLWKWIKENKTDNFKLTYAEIESIAGLPIDHSFLKFKKELLDYGFKVGKISMKEQTVSFDRHCEPLKEAWQSSLIHCLVKNGKNDLKNIVKSGKIVLENMVKSGRNILEW